MRYKEQALNKLEQVGNVVSTTEFLISRGDQNGSLESIIELKEKLEELRSIISIEHEEFDNYAG
jgi:hypothetical protein